MSDHPSVAESFDRLPGVGWSVGDFATAAGWCVNGTNGENRIEERGSTQAAAWWRACEAARAVGMLTPTPGLPCRTAQMRAATGVITRGRGRLGLLDAAAQGLLLRRLRRQGGGRQQTRGRRARKTLE